MAWPMLPLGCLSWKKKKTNKQSKGYCTTEGCLERKQARKDEKHNEWIVIYGKELSMQYKIGL